MYKVHNQQQSLPTSITATVPDDAPTAGATHVTSDRWLEKYGCGQYAKSIFYKGPLLYTDTVDNKTCTSFTNVFKRNIKKLLLDMQSSEDPNEWQHTNHKLYNIAGLRRSDRN